MDVFADPRQRLVRVGYRQQVVEEGRIVGRPRQMLGKEARRIAIDEFIQSREVRAIEGPVRPDRQADAMQRERVTLANRGQVPVRRAAGAHIIFRMNFKKAHIGPRLEDLAIVLRLEPDPGAVRNSGPAEATGL